MSTEYILVNDFMFCRSHGGELCNQCTCDHRMCNNIRIEEDHPRIFAKLGLGADFDIEERKPILVYPLGAIPSGRKGGADGNDLYQCKEHGSIDCKKCFDWPKVIIRQAQRKPSSSKSEGRIQNTMDLMGLLQSIGIELPASTKLSEDDLEKKFATALTLSQNISSGQFPLNPSSLPVWKTKNGNTPASQAIYRISTAELTKRMELPADQPFPLYINSFLDARSTLQELAKIFTELGQDIVILNDPKGVEAICVRILEIYELKPNTPLIALLYLSADKSTPPENTATFAQYHMQRLVGRLPQVMCAQEEQALFRKLLFQNHQRLSPDFQPAKQRYEEPFKPSFLLPLNPLSQSDIGKLSHTGCEVCGAKTTSRCTQCLLVSYCGKVCQREHWPKHKMLCKAMKGGTWIPTKFHKYIVIDGKRMDSGIFNNAGPLKMDNIVYNDQEDSSPPPNAHGDRPFLVKIQKLKYAPRDASFNPGSLTDDLHFMTDRAGNRDIPHPDGLLLYDRSRSFHAFVMQKQDAEVYVLLAKEIAARNHRDKIYRWAKRSGDFEFSICWDRAPGEPAW